MVLMFKNGKCSTPAWMLVTFSRYTIDPPHSKLNHETYQFPTMH